MILNKKSGILNIINNNAFSLLALIVACVLIYFPTFHNQFQNFWDDQWVVVNNYTANGFTLTNLKKIFTEFYHGQYAPINQLFYTILYKLFGYSSFWFHGFCLLAHLLNVVLVFYFIKRLLKLHGNFEACSVWRISFFTALLFAIHPFLVEAVGWVSASKVILYSFFYLIALHCYLYYTIALKLRYYLYVLLFFIISFGAKEQAVTLPVCLVLIDYVLKRDLKDLQVWLEKLPLIILAISFGLFTILSQAVTGSGVLSHQPSYPIYQRLIFASYALTEYFFKCIIPCKLSYLYPFPNPVGQSVPIRFWIYPFAILTIIFCLWSFWKKPWVFFGVAFFIIHIGIALHIIPISRFAIVADRYVYLASIGLFFIIGWLLDKAYLKIKYVNIITTFSIFYLILLGIYANQRVKDWYNTDTIKKEMRGALKQRKDYTAPK